MRRALMVGAIVTGLFLGMSGAAVPSGAEKPKVVCWKFDASGSTKQFRTAPRKCFMFKRGATYNAEGAAATSHVHWRWGYRRAKGKGKLGISTVGEVPARFRLTKPVEKCGRTVFSKLNVRYHVPPGPDYPGGPDHPAYDGHYAFHLYTC